MPISPAWHNQNKPKYNSHLFVADDRRHILHPRRFERKVVGIAGGNLPRRSDVGTVLAEGDCVRVAMELYREDIAGGVPGSEALQLVALIVIVSARAIVVADVGFS